MAVNQLIKEKGYNYTSNTFDVLIQDPDTDVLIAHADSLSESGMDITNEMSEKRGGSQNAILYYIPTTKTLSVNMTSIAFDEAWLSMQTGERFSIGEYTIGGRTASCAVESAGGKRTITLPEPPVGVYVYVKNGFNNIPVAIPSTASETIDVTDLTEANDTCLEVVYASKAKVKHMSIKSNTPPSVVKLTMTKTVYNGSTNKPIKKFIVVIPRFQLDGNFSFAGTLGDSDTMSLSGNAIAAKSTQCGDTEQVLADMFIEEIDENGLVPLLIKTADEYEVTVGQKDNITVFGQLGSDIIYDNTAYDVTSECKYVVQDAAIATVKQGGEIEGVSAGSTTVTIQHKNCKTTTKVRVV